MPFKPTYSSKPRESAYKVGKDRKGPLSKMFGKRKGT